MSGVKLSGSAEKNEFDWTVCITPFFRLAEARSCFLSQLFIVVCFLRMRNIFLDLILGKINSNGSSSYLPPSF